MITLLLLMVSLANAETKIIGGKVSNPLDWPEVVKLSPVGCTATIVGPRALLTAAHCSKNKNQSFILDKATYKVVLTQHPKYRGGNMNHDVALGVIDQEIKTVYGNISKDLSVGMKLKVVGYGANTLSNTGFGILREGETSVTGIGVGDFTATGGNMIYYGDSGGPAFDLNMLPQKFVVGVHSRTQSGKKSYETRMDYSLNQEFFEQWSKDNNQPVCGVTAVCQ